MVRIPSRLAQPWRLAPCPCSPWRASTPPAAWAGAQGRSPPSSPPNNELELLLVARRLSRTRLATAVRHERQQAAQERAALQQQLDRARGKLRQAQQDMSAIQAALQEAEGAAGRAHQERAALLKEIKLERAERAGATERAALAERRCQVGAGGPSLEEDGGRSLLVFPSLGTALGTGGGVLHARLWTWQVTD